MMNAKLSPQRFWSCRENRLLKMIQTIPHNLYVSVNLNSLYFGLRLMQVYLNPQYRKSELKLTQHKMCGVSFESS